MSKPLRGADCLLVHRYLDDLTSALFRWGGRLRRARAFHPHGVAFRATVEVDGEGLPPALSPGSHPAVVRFSRGIGLRRRLPDIHGVALRIPDAHGPGQHQDLLLATVASPGLGRFLPWLTGDLTGGFYSVVAPYATPAGRRLVGLRVQAPGRYELPTAEDMVWTGRCRLELCTTHRLEAWTPVATVALHADRLSPEDEGELGFDPWNTAEGFQPVGWVNRLRRPAYAASRAGRPGGGDGRAPSQPVP